MFFFEPNFFQLAQQTMPHIDEVRASKSSFQLGRVLSFVNNVASSTVAKICKNTLSPWTALSDAISELVAQANALFPSTLDIENIIKSVASSSCLGTLSYCEHSHRGGTMDRSH